MDEAGQRQPEAIHVVACAYLAAELEQLGKVDEIPCADQQLRFTSGWILNPLEHRCLVVFLFEAPPVFIVGQVSIPVVVFSRLIEQPLPNIGMLDILGAELQI